MTAETHHEPGPHAVWRHHPTIRSRWVMVNGTRTHYVEDGGNGPAVVMVHSGTPGSSGVTWFGRILPLLGRASFQAYALDSIGGYGWTDPSTPAPKGALSRLEHLEAFIDTLCLDRVIIVGASQGSWVAAKYAVRHPDRVQALVVSSSRALGSAMGLDIVDPPTVFDGSREGMRRTLAKAIYDADDITDELIDYCLDVATRPGVKESRRIYQEGQRLLTQDPVLRQEFDLTSALPRLTLPAVGFWGTSDQNALPAWGESLAELLPNVTCRFLDQAGHQIYRDRAAEITRVICELV